jgi:excisionase family DNA binding protein
VLALSYKRFLLGDVKHMQLNTATQRVAWSIAEIAEATGLSEGYLRNEVKRGALPIKKFGRRVLVLEEDLKSYLTQGSVIDEATDGDRKA